MQAALTFPLPQISLPGCAPKMKAAESNTKDAARGYARYLIENGQLLDVFGLSGVIGGWF